MAAIIFDLDGTIADSFDYVAGFLAKEAGLPTLDETQKLELRGISMTAMARRLGHPWWRLMSLFLKGRSRMAGSINHLQAFGGMPGIIEKLHAEGHELFVVSSNSVKNVHKFLHHHNLHTYFLQTYGGAAMFGKAPVLRRLLKEQNLELHNAIYVGDEIRDVQAAQSIGLRVVAVTWGFARPSDLADMKPTALADTPDDLMRILEEV